MTLDELLPQDRFFPRVKAADKAALLAELARRAGAVLGLPPEPIAAGLAAREALGSTGIGAGFAVPHARLPGLPAPIGFFIRLERPIAFDAIDAQPVDLLFLLLSPPEATAAICPCSPPSRAASATSRWPRRSATQAMQARFAPPCSARPDISPCHGKLCTKPVDILGDNRAPSPRNQPESTACSHCIKLRQKT